MALPTLITVYGTYLKLDGTPERGSITFKSNVYSLDSDSATIVVPDTLTTYLDETGSVAITVPATNDPEWTPVGWTYTFIAQFSSSFYSFEVVIPYDAPGGAIEVTKLVPAQSANSQLYAAYSHSHSQYVTRDEINDVIAETAEPIVLDTVQNQLGNYATDIEVTQAIASITKASLGLGNVTNTADSAKPVSTLQQTALNTKIDKSLVTQKGDLLAASASATVSKLSIGVDEQILTVDSTQPTGLKWVTPVPTNSGSSIKVYRQYVTSGDFVSIEENSWTPITGLLVTVPAAVGDNLDLSVNCLIDRGTGADNYYDTVVLANSAVVRYGSTGTASPSAANEGDPSIYPQVPGQRFSAIANLNLSVEVTSNMLVGGNITFSLVHRGVGGGKIFASANYPFRWHVINFGQ